MVKGASLAENVLVLRRGEQHGIHMKEESAICPAKSKQAESLLVSHGYMVEYTSRKLCAFVTGTLVKRIIDDEALPPILRSQWLQELFDNPHSQSCREMQPVHMRIGKKTVIRVLGKAFPQFLHALLHVEAGRAEGIAEDVGEKELDGNAFRLDAATGTKYVDDLKI